MLPLNLDLAQNIKGWMSNEELVWLAERARHCSTIIEFGCYKGRSTRALADNCNGIIYAVDPWDGVYYRDDNTIHDIKTDVFHDFASNLEDHIKLGKVIPIKDYSWSFNKPVQADLIFIDGDHRYESVLDDIKTALKFVRAGGIISGHDYGHYDWPGVKKAVDTIFSSVKVVDSIWYREV